MNRKISMSPQCVDELLGSVGADEENDSRLLEFYFKGTAYEQLRSPYAYHIVIGRKGTGKTALLRLVGLEDEAKGRLVVDMSFSRSAEVVNVPVDYNEAILFWKNMFERELVGALKRRVSLIDLPTSGFQNCDTWRDLSFVLQGALSNNPIATRKGIQDDVLVEMLLAAARMNQLTINIDNLDRAWQSDKRSMCALAALLDMFRELIAEYRGLRINVALRTDVYYQILSTQESMDKLSSAQVFLEWSLQEILALTVKRVISYAGTVSYDDQVLLKLPQSNLIKLLSPLIEERFLGRGAWEDAPINKVLLSLVRGRPRDMVNLLRDASRYAHKQCHSRIMTEDLIEVLPKYSQSCLTEICTEYGGEVQNLKELLPQVARTRKENAGRKGESGLFTTSELNAKLKKVAVNARLYFSGQFHVATPDDLRNFLFRIGFISGKKVVQGKSKWVTYEDEWMLGGVHYDKEYDWEIHPAYRFAIGDSAEKLAVMRDFKRQN